MLLSPFEQREIEALRKVPEKTLRATVPALENILYEPQQVLDHGFVRVVDYMGNDSAVVQAARVSYGTGTKRARQDAGLIRYLMRHWHTTPFEMCEIKFHVKLPIFVARQWIRHRTASVNEYSARYSILDNEFYIPEPEHLAAQSTSNRQGRGQTLVGKEAAHVLDLLRTDAERAYESYEEMLNEDAQGRVSDESRQGLARELARMNLSLNFYTQWYWKVNLHNLLHFLWLRSDAHAQYEIRAYANQILKTVERWVPVTYEAFMDYRVNGVRLSAKGLEVVRRMLRWETVRRRDVGMSPAEWRELQTLLGRGRTSETTWRQPELPSLLEMVGPQPSAHSPAMWGSSGHASPNVSRANLRNGQQQRARPDQQQLDLKSLDVLRRRLRGEPVTPRDVNMSPAEWRELTALLEAEEAPPDNQ